MGEPATKFRPEHRTGDHDRIADDFYIEEEWGVQALFLKERFRGRCWDPAAGCGTIVRVGRLFGIDIFGTDLRERAGQVALGITAELDFLQPDRAWLTGLPNPSNIIFNPPYKLAEDFIRQALRLVDNKVAALLNLRFLESQRRQVLFKTAPLARVLVFANRLHCPPPDLDLTPGGGQKAYAWFIWDLDHHGPPTLDWLSKPVQPSTK